MRTTQSTNAAAQLGNSEPSGAAPANAHRALPLATHAIGKRPIAKLSTVARPIGKHPIATDPIEKNLLQFREDFLLVIDDGIQRRLILQNRALVLLDRFLIGLDRFLVADDGGLIRQDPLLVCNASVGHLETPSEFEFNASSDSGEARTREAIVFLEELEAIVFLEPGTLPIVPHTKEPPASQHPRRLRPL
jgi:hypothetical protein